MSAHTILLHAGNPAGSCQFPFGRRRAPHPSFFFLSSFLFHLGPLSPNHFLVEAVRKRFMETSSSSRGPVYKPTFFFFLKRGGGISRNCSDAVHENHPEPSAAGLQPTA